MYQIEIGNDRETVLITYATYQDKCKTAIGALEASCPDATKIKKFKEMYTQVCVGIEEVKGLDNLPLLSAAVNMLVQFERVLAKELEKASTTSMAPDLLDLIDAQTPKGPFGLNPMPEVASITLGQNEDGGVQIEDIKGKDGQSIFRNSVAGSTFEPVNAVRPRPWVETVAGWTGDAAEFHDPTVSHDMNVMLGESPLPIVHNRNPDLNRGAGAQIISLIEKRREKADDMAHAKRLESAFQAIEVRRLDGDIMNPIRVAKILFADEVSGIVNPGFFSIEYEENGEVKRTAVTPDDRCELPKVMLDALKMKEEGVKVFFVMQREPT